LQSTLWGRHPGTKRKEYGLHIGCVHDYPLHAKKKMELVIVSSQSLSARCTCIIQTFFVLLVFDVGFSVSINMDVCIQVVSLIFVS